MSFDLVSPPGCTSIECVGLFYRQTDVLFAQDVYICCMDSAHKVLDRLHLENCVLKMHATAGIYQDNNKYQFTFQGMNLRIYKALHAIV